MIKNNMAHQRMRHRTNRSTRIFTSGGNRPENLSRRGFLGGIGAAGAGVSLSSLLGACGLGSGQQGEPIGIPPTSRRLKA
ncbi:MAG TPA: twin-arginine translocation signal domain-containing protein, partial [Ktedonobacteraceae bacterium]|nr:twin-arginine translocation signal domain-containing protein [Ktedonobacteraceae bacterium]